MGEDGGREIVLEKEEEGVKKDRRTVGEVANGSVSGLLFLAISNFYLRGNAVAYYFFRLLMVLYFSSCVNSNSSPPRGLYLNWGGGGIRLNKSIPLPPPSTSLTDIIQAALPSLSLRWPQRPDGPGRSPASPILAVVPRSTSNLISPAPLKV